MRIKTGRIAVPILLMGILVNPLRIDSAEYTLPRPTKPLLHYTVTLPHIKVASRSESSGDWHQAQAEITAYSPHDNVSGIEAEGDGSKTSIGVPPGYGKFAVDPKRIPYGSKIIIEYENGNVEQGIAADTGGAMRHASGILIDVYRDTYRQCDHFGRRKATVKWRKL